MKSIALFIVGIVTASIVSYADELEITEVVELKKIKVRFSKQINLEMGQFVRDIGRAKTEEDKKSPNYRLLYQSAKLQTPDEGDTRVSCTIYQKVSLSRRAKSYAEESVVMEKNITEKAPLALSTETEWKITKAVPNELGIMLWLSGDKKTLQIDCEKTDKKGEEKKLTPHEVFYALWINEGKFTKDGNDVRPSAKKTDEAIPTPATLPVDSTEAAPPPG